MHQIIINGETFHVSDGTVLSEFLMKSEKKVEHPCGGRGTCKKCKVIVNGKVELSCRYVVHSDITVETINVEHIISETGAKENGSLTDHMCLVLDIGTTTLALGLVSLDTHQIIRTITATNPQRAFGADVMSRIDYCQKNGVQDLHSTIITCVNQMISDLQADYQVEQLYVAGNTTMLHLFLGVDCTSMGMAPYTPVFLESRCVNADEIGIRCVNEVVTLPSIATFVGADLVAGLNYVEMPKEDTYSLLIDLGTNAETVLFSKHDILCTAAAAGPCFEGAGISCGMSATNGAIYSYAFPEEYHTVGDAPAKGICGTGIIDIVAELVQNEIIDETGYMEDEIFSITEEISLSQNDVREYQLAKSAVCSAIQTLMKIRNLSFEDIENVYISGGFSAKINLENAKKTGLLPREVADKCIAINNSSFLGTVKYACEQNELSGYLEDAKYIDLSSNPIFTDLFVENMMFEIEE